MLFVESYGTLFQNELADDSKFLVLSVNSGKDKSGKTQYDSWPVSFSSKLNDKPEPGTSFKFKGICKNTYSAKTKKSYPSILIYEILDSKNAPVSEPEPDEMSFEETMSLPF